MRALLRSAAVAWVLAGAAAPRAGLAAPSEPVRVQGAGASFPARLYRAWFEAFRARRPDVRFEYLAVGSGAGLRRFVDRTVDFAGTDAPMSPEEIAQVDGGVRLVPVTGGGVALALHLPGVERLRLTREAYARIFLGELRTWRDPAIAAANPGLALPDMPVKVVVRADPSGTTLAFSRHLSAVNPAFGRSPGTDRIPNWPAAIRARGGEGVAASIRDTPGAIGYLEAGLARASRLAIATLENRAGAFQDPTAAACKAALDQAALSDNLVAWSADPGARDAYPVVTSSWIAVYRRYADASKHGALLEFLRWAVGDGQRTAELLGYVPLPAAVAERVMAALDENRGDSQAGRSGTP